MNVQVPWSKVKVKQLIFAQMWTSCVTRSWSNHWSSSHHCLTNILLTIWLIITKLDKMVASRKLIFIVYMQAFWIFNGRGEGFMFLSCKIYRMSIYWVYCFFISYMGNVHLLAVIKWCCLCDENNNVLLWLHGIAIDLLGCHCKVVYYWQIQKCHILIINRSWNNNKLWKNLWCSRL